jgi:hypothetical protein
MKSAGSLLVLKKLLLGQTAWEARNKKNRYPLREHVGINRYDWIDNNS